jgi:hypothetical protein
MLGEVEAVYPKGFLVDFYVQPIEVQFLPKTVQKPGKIPGDESMLEKTGAGIHGSLMPLSTKETLI